MNNLKRLVWLYFILLLSEGALRKWFLPGLATPLLLVRDPVVIALYALAFHAGVFPKNQFINALIVLVFLSLPLGLLQVSADKTTLAVMFFGLRTNFLHVPLIFLLPKILSPEDVRRLGQWVLILALPMAVLMLVQFQSPPAARINAAIGDGLQLQSALGRIRPPGTFSFITGAVDFYALVTAFFTYSLTAKRTYPKLLIVAVGLGLVTAVAVSGSRSALLASLVVFAMFFLGLIFTRRLASGLTNLAVLGLVILAVVSHTALLNEGIETFKARWALASQFEAQSGGIGGRYFGDLIRPFLVLDRVPLLGYGIGCGTNVGAQLLAGSASSFLLSESEWGRLIYEGGPLVGTLCILFRVALAVWLGAQCVLAARAGNILPLLLFGACATNVLSGQFGPATSLGFTVFVGGLCLAAIPPPGAQVKTAAAGGGAGRKPRWPRLRRNKPNAVQPVAAQASDHPAPGME